jgi:3-oxoacyl-[acyl-carrier-protein] synthase II
MKKTIELNRVVVTGIGMVTSLGLDVPTTWEAMLSGKSGIDWITQWGDLDEVKAKFKLAEDFPLIAGEVKDFNIKDIVKQRKHGFEKLIRIGLASLSARVWVVPSHGKTNLNVS